MRGPIEQGLADRIKVKRTLTRLKHAIAADHELNATLDALKRDYIKSVQKGKLPAAIDLKALDVS